MKKHFILKPKPSEVVNNVFSEIRKVRLFRDREEAESLLKEFESVHELDFYLDEETKELTGRDGGYVADIFHDKRLIGLWHFCEKAYFHSLTIPNPENLTEENLGSLLRFVWDIQDMKIVRRRGFEIIRASDGKIMRIKKP